VSIHQHLLGFEFQQHQCNANCVRDQRVLDVLLEAGDAEVSFAAQAHVCQLTIQGHLGVDVHQLKTGLVQLHTQQCAQLTTKFWRSPLLSTPPAEPARLARVTLVGVGAFSSRWVVRGRRRPSAAVGRPFAARRVPAIGSGLLVSPAVVLTGLLASSGRPAFRWVRRLANGSGLRVVLVGLLAGLSVAQM
jgi:hypothetical protein